MEEYLAAYAHGFRYVLVIFAKRLSASHNEFYRTLTEAESLAEDFKATGSYTVGIFELENDGAMRSLNKGK